MLKVIQRIRNISGPGQRTAVWWLGDNKVRRTFFSSTPTGLKIKFSEPHSNAYAIPFPVNLQRLQQRQAVAFVKPGFKIGYDRLAW